MGVPQGAQLVLPFEDKPPPRAMGCLWVCVSSQAKFLRAVDSQRSRSPVLAGWVAFVGRGRCPAWHEVLVGSTASLGVLLLLFQECAGTCLQSWLFASKDRKK